MASTSSSSSSSGLLTTSSTGNVLRLTGLASGLDVDGTVKKMMTGQQTKIDKAQQEKQKIQWRQEAYQDIIAQIDELQNSFFDVTSNDTNILSSNNYAAFSATSSDSSLTTVGTVNPGVGSATGNYGLIVNQLASGAGVTKTLGSGITASSKLSSVDSSLTGDIDLALNINTGSQNKNIQIKFTNDGTKTVGDLVSAINSQGGGDIKATYSEVTHKLSITTANTGSTTTLSVDSTAFDSSTQKGSSTGGLTLFDTGATKTPTGQDAKFKIKEPGQSDYSDVITKSSNSFTIDGVDYSLTGVSSAPASSDTSGVSTSFDGGTTTKTYKASTFTVAQDTSKAFDKIKSFIDKYNAIVKKVQTALTEKTNKDYPPLTDTQKDSMTTDQIKAWETKAKAGILRNDNNLQNMLTSLESAFSTPVDGVNMLISKYGSKSIGLDTSNGKDNVGQIRITDAAKLKDAIANKSDELIKFFTGKSSITITTSSTQTDKNNHFTQSGIFSRVKEIVEDNVGYTGTTLNNAILTKYANYQDNYSTFSGAGLNTLPDQIYQKDSQIKDLKTQYTSLQTRYYNQFSQLETALTKLNSQSSYIQSMLGGS